MDEKVVKTPLYTSETVFKDSAEVPVDIEFNLPDYCPEISRILKCRAVPRVSSKAAANHSVTVDGGVTVTVIYADSEDKINSYEYQYPFSKSFDTGTETQGGCVAASVRCEYINCRAVTERKVDIHGALSVGVTVTQRQCKEIIGDIEDKNIKVRKVSAPATVPAGEAEKYVLLDEEIEAGTGAPDVKCLIRYDAAAQIDECKLLAGKAIVKGSVAVNLLYRGDEGDAQPLSVAIPFSQLIEIDGADEGQTCEANAYIAYLEMKPKFASSGEARAFSLDGKININVKTYNDENIDMINDAYSTGFEAQIASEDITVGKLILSINDTFTAKKELDLSGVEVSRICDIWCETVDGNAKVEGDCLKVCGALTVGVIAKDSAGAPHFFEKNAEYEYTYKLPAGCENISANPSVSVKEINYTLSGENSMEIRAQMSVRAAVYEVTRVPVISGVTVDESKPLDSKFRSPLTVYFADAGESLWDISRRYLADAERVKEINGIKEDNVTKRQMILLF